MIKKSALLQESWLNIFVFPWESRGGRLEERLALALNFSGAAAFEPPDTGHTWDGMHGRNHKK